jgi:hypothetical protein
MELGERKIVGTEGVERRGEVGRGIHCLRRGMEA